MGIRIPALTPDTSTYVLFHVPSMDHTLFPAFILQSVGLIVKKTAKIHCEDPSVEDHFIFDEESGLRIPLSLNGIFSVFKTRLPSEKEIEEVENYHQSSSPRTLMFGTPTMKVTG